MGEAESLIQFKDISHLKLLNEVIPISICTRSHTIAGAKRKKVENIA